MKLWAERRAGELLPDIVSRGRPKRLHRATFLKDLGIDKFESTRWQALARIPEPSFAAHIAETKAKAKELTTAELPSDQ